MNKLRVGVVGVGKLGALHTKMYAQIPKAELVGIFDSDAGRARDVASEFRTTIYPSLENLLKDVNVISITTPTTTHYQIAMHAIDAGVHLFIEKPITHSSVEGEKLVQHAKQKGITIQVGHIERFNPAILAVEAYNLQPMFIESHRLAQFNPRGTDVAVVLDLMIHDIDIILSLVKSPVSMVQADGVAVVSDTVDIANARLKFANGCVANVTASRISQKKMRKMRLFQKDAYISVDFLDGKAEVFRLIDSDQASDHRTKLLGRIEDGSKRRNITYERPKVKEVNPLRYELELFLEAVESRKPPVVSGEDGLRALNVAQQILETIDRQSVRMA
jgi:predicted dehydrogenase